MFCDDSIHVILRHLFYEYHYSPHKLAFQNIMRAGDQKLMITLEWPYCILQHRHRGCCPFMGGSRPEKSKFVSELPRFTGADPGHQVGGHKVKKLRAKRAQKF